MFTKRILWVLLFITVAASVGCTTRYASNDLVTPPVAKLERGQHVYIVLPQSGRYGNTIYGHSGMNTAMELQNILVPYTAKTRISARTENIATALASGKASGARFVFIPVILEWEHRIAAWSGLASVVALTVSVYDLDKPEQEQRILVRELRGKGRNITFKSQYPEEILRPLIRQFAQDIF